jgi:D-ribulokinase
MVDTRARQDIWLGIDVGTQSAKVIAASEHGEVLAYRMHPLTSRRQARRHEQDAGEWWSAVVQACAATTEQVRTHRICGVTVDGTSGTILLVDKAGQPRTPAIMYDDERAPEAARQVNEISAALSNSITFSIQATWALPKLLWFVRECPEVIRSARLIHQADFINWRLAGQQLASDWSNALKTGYDLHDESWRYRLFEVIGIAEEILPPVVRPGTQIGTVCEAAAAVTGIPTGTPILAGMTDGCAAQIAAGALQIGDWNSVLGTTLVLKGVTQEPVHDSAGVLYSHRSPDGHWLPGGACNAGAAALSKHFSGRDLDALTMQAAGRESAKVVVFPLVGCGERFPFHAPEAETFVLGKPADEVDLFAGVLHGVAFMERLCFDYLDLLGAPLSGRVTFTGSAVRNRQWCQLRADVLGRTVHIPENTEPAFGMAILASAGREGVANAAKRMVRTAEVIEPRPERTIRLLEAYLQLIGNLEQRGWLPSNLASHAVMKTEQRLTTTENVA